MQNAAESQASVWLNGRHDDYHRRQFVEPYRSTVRLRDFVARVLGPDVVRACRALDVGCGAGANMFHLSRLLPRAHWTGIDIAADLFDIGRSEIGQDGGMEAPPDFVAGDFYALAEIVTPGSFDLAFSIQTLSWLPGYDDILPGLMSMVKPGGWIFITSLFTDSLVDARIQITEFEPNGESKAPMFYNIYCWDRFAETCRRLGAVETVWEDFQLDVELPRPAHRRMGTFTRRCADGSLLQCSGPLLMPWRFAAIRMGGATAR